MDRANILTEASSVPGGTGSQMVGEVGAMVETTATEVAADGATEVVVVVDMIATEVVTTTLPPIIPPYSGTNKQIVHSLFVLVYDFAFIVYSLHISFIC